jgi:predicted GH43/DUF377 family glycosyl hydrolase/glycosyltransferase involved in cell wall biosynthesis
MRIAFVSSNLPRRCGIATFTSDLMAAVRAHEPATRCRVAAIDEPNIVRPYGPEVRWRIRQGDPDSYREAARSINESNADIVCVQHEFGLYGVWPQSTFVDGTWIEGAYEDHLKIFLEELRKPVLTTMHTVLPEPSRSIRDAVLNITELSHEVVVMANTAVQILTSRYGVKVPPVVIHHGMPAIEPKGRRRLKAKLGVDGRQIISTFGLVDPRKGLEYMIEAMPDIVARHPDALYLIAGQTHPELLRHQGEDYRNRLVDTVNKLGLRDSVAFVNQYLTQRDIIDYLLASDVYVTPYLDKNQITSGTLAYALGAGKAVVSTPYLHAEEALAEDRGLLVDFRSSTQLGDAVLSILDDPHQKAQLEHAAYDYAKGHTWPKSGARFLGLMNELVTTVKTRQPERRKPRRERDSSIGVRLPENPLLTPRDVQPSRPELEVVSVFNASASRVGDEIVLMLRVAERPRTDIDPPANSVTLDLTGPHPKAVPLPPGISREKLVGLAFLDADRPKPEVVVAYLPRDLPGLDLSDPRTIRYRNSQGGFTHAADDFNDFLTQMSHLRVARSRDGVHFEVDPQPAVVPENGFEEFGVEDPRATLIDGRWEITYVSAGRLGISTSRVSTTDFRTFERHGMMFLPDQKDVVLFPEKIDGRYVALTRPMPASFSRVLGIWIAFSDDLVNWGGHQPLALPRAGMWDELRTGGSAVPFLTDDGWLEIYHGVDRNSRYALGALLLDRDDPTRVLARSATPILVPVEPYERHGLFNDTVFTCGHVTLDEGNIRVYYGGADTCLAAADFSIAQILDHMQPQRGAKAS